LAAIAGDLPEAAGGSYVRTLPDGSLSIDGAAPAYELEDCLGALPPGEFDTAAGMALSLFGHLPAAGERVGWNGWELEVAELRRRRVTRLLARKKTNSGSDPDSVRRTGRRSRRRASCRARGARAPRSPR